MTSRFQQATCFLMFSAMSEIMLSMYDNTTLIIHHDSALHTKLKNLRTNFERVSEKAYLMFPEDEQLSFMKMITVFEKLIDSSKDEQKFMELMGLIESWQNDEITMINTKDRLVEIADQIKNREETQEINGLL
jgi:hypothetical protein